MSCPWFSHSLINGYNVVVLLGEPGSGKTTAALHLVAYDLRHRGVVETHEEAVVEASKRLFLGASTEELVEFLRAQIRKKRRRDWIIIDDAALGFLDVESTHAWSAIMDSLKVARNALAERGVIITSTGRRYVAERLIAMAKVVYVSKREAAFNTYWTPAGGCLASSETNKTRNFVVLKRIEWMVKSHDTLTESEAKMGLYAYIVGLIPVDRRFAMPREVEEVHIEARMRRVEAQLEKALELLKKKKKARESDQIE
jgi:RecA/RadA recombinase